MDTPSPHAMDRYRSKPRFDRRWFAVGALSVGVILIALWVLATGAERRYRAHAHTITLAQVESGQFRDFVPLRGRIVPRDVVYLDAIEGGRVEKVLFEVGDKVAAGDILVIFSNTALQLDVIEREVRVIEQINVLRNTEQSLEQARLANARALLDIDYNIKRLSRSLDRRGTLAAKGVATAEERDKIQDELDWYVRTRVIVSESNHRQDELRMHQLPEVRDSLVKLEENLIVTREKLKNLTARAPVSGRLTAMDLKIGQNANRGERLGEIVPETGIKIFADVDEFYLGRVKANQAVDVQIGEAIIATHIARIQPQVKDGRFQVDLDFDNAPPAGLLPGQSISGKLRLGQDRPALVLPSGEFLQQTGGDWVFVAAPDGQVAVRRRIKVGRRNQDQLEILDGLTAGEKVMISSYEGLEQIDKVTLTQ